LIKLVLAYDAVAVPDEIVENIEDLGLHVRGCAVAAKFSPIDVKLAVGKCEDHRKRPNPGRSEPIGLAGH
jgi:hypothetical protein